MTRRKNIIELIISAIGVYILLFGAVCFNKYFLMQFPLRVRMVLMPVLQWIPLLVPGIFMLRDRKYAAAFGFSRKSLGKQIMTGVCIALMLSVILTVIPISLGFRNMVGDNSYTQVWQFIYQFGYAIIGVAAAEELLFRGYFYYRFLDLNNSRWFAILGSSVLFGFYHIFNFDPFQIVFTTAIGVLYCFCREKVKYCTLLSLILAHGIYDALITVWLAVL